MRKPILVVMTAILLLVSATVAMAADPFVGTWKMNAAKSMFNPGPPLKSETAKIEAQDNGIKVTYDGVDGDGKAYTEGAALKYDGKDYPTFGDPNSDTITMKKINASTFEWALKQAGKEVERGWDTFSKDGKTMTLNAKGKAFSFTIVYDKQ